eukprot:8225357-Pyramimonas_sp.AAC.1
MPVVAGTTDVCTATAKTLKELATELESSTGPVEEEKEKATEDTQEETSKEANEEEETKQVIPWTTANIEEPGTS